MDLYQKQAIVAEALFRTGNRSVDGVLSRASIAKVQGTTLSTNLG